MNANTRKGWKPLIPQERRQGERAPPKVSRFDTKVSVFTENYAWLSAQFLYLWNQTFKGKEKTARW